MGEYTRHFAELSAKDALIAGGKGASLGEMHNSGITVPEGFVVLSTTFDRFIKATGLEAEIAAELDKVNHKEVHTVERASETIKALILGHEVPVEIQKEITEKFEKLNAQFVAVRSSATAEDSSAAAWAGQLESFLNTTKKCLLENVKKCWASLFTPRAIFYRFEKGLRNTNISVAVVVQKMVESQESGIAFSVHPVTQDFNQLIIEAGFGLGEAIVSGQITPDSYVVDKRSWKIIELTVNEQAKGLYRKADGGNEWKQLAEKGKKQVLSEKEITELSKLIAKIEDHYGFPVDVEWAREKGKFYIVQSRPITTLEKLEKEQTLVEKFKKEIGDEEVFVLRGKFIPLFLMTDWLRFYDKKFQKKKGVYPVLSLKKKGLFYGYLSLNRYLDASREGIQRYIENKEFKRNICARYEKIKRKINNFYNDYFANTPKKDDELLKVLRVAEQNLHEVVALTLFIDFLDSNIIKKIYSEKGFYFDYDKIFEVANIYDFPSFDLKNNIEILKWANRNTEYLKYIYTGYSAAPTKKETERKISRIDLTKLKKDVINSEKELEKRIKKKKNFRNKLNKKEKRVADFISWISELRDDRKILMNKMDVLMNESVKSLYSNWKIDRSLSLYSFAFEVLKGKKFVLENIESVRKRDNDFVNLYYGKEKYEEKFDGLEKEFAQSELLEKPKRVANIIKGQIANKGKAKGFARVIHDPQKTHSFMEGEVLVTGMTRPEFISIIKKASAIVTDEGGIGCHAAIVSRELNKPCVIGTKNATEIIQDGDLLDVDADNGVIKILESGDKAMAEMYKTQISLSEWLDKINHRLTEKIRIEDNEKRERLSVLNKIIGLGFDKPTKFSPKDIADQSPEFREFLKNRGEEKCALRLIPLEKSLPKLRMRGQKIKDVIITWFPEQKIAYEKYRAEFIPHPEKNIWATIFIVNKKGIFGEIIKDGHHTLTQGFYSKAKPITFSYDFKTWKLNPKKKEALCYLKDMIKSIYVKDKKLREKISNRLGSKFANEYICGYFETTHSEFGTWFIDYNRILGDIYSDYEIINPKKGKLSGIVGNKGVARGKVHIIENPSAEELETGEVLVCDMTKPEFLPAMKKASAIVTKRGGLLSHAAIIARELGKPCIVAVQNALELLKTGDYVKVDADKGIVKIISKK